MEPEEIHDTPERETTPQYTVKERLQIISEFESSNQSIEEFTKERGIKNRYKLQRWIMQKQKLESQPLESVRAGSGRKPLYIQLEKQLSIAFQAARAKGSWIDYKWLRKSAIEIFIRDYPEREVPLFSNKWILLFLQRHDLKVCGFSAPEKRQKKNEIKQ